MNDGVSRRSFLFGRLGVVQAGGRRDWRPRGAALVSWLPAHGEAPAASAAFPPGAVAEIVPERCLAHLGSFCSTCVERCPAYGALGMVDGKPVVDPMACTGCGVCAAVCPAPQRAVRAAGS